MKVTYKKILPTIFSHLLIVFIAAIANGQKIDLNFYPVITTNDNAIVNTSAVQPDGKILIAGTFSAANGYQQSGVARLLPDGKTDESFQPVTLINGSYAGYVYDIKIQPDGKILIAGGLAGVNGQIRRGIARLNVDGSLDTSFATVFSEVSYRVNSIALQPDGKILVAGNLSSSRNLVRLNSDGTIDGSFQNPVPDKGELTKVVLQPDGRIVVAYQIYEDVWKTKIIRLNNNGSLDTSFATVDALGTGATSGGSPTVNAILLQPDGKLVIGGSLNSIAGVQKNRLAQLNADGTLDNSFLASADAAVFALARQTDGQIIAGGDFTQINGTPQKYLARLNADGSLDNSLKTDFPGPFTAILTISLQSDGKIITGGQFLNVGGALRYRIARLNTDGNLDGSFNFVLIGSPGSVTVTAPRADGKIFVAGQFSYVGGEYHNLLALINPDGTVDKSFQNQNFGDNFFINTVLPLPDNKVLVGGNILLYAADGRLYRNLIRFNANGTLDTTFPNTLAPSSSEISTLVVQPDGKILVGGLITNANGVPQNGIIRINTDGSIDSTFQTVISGANYYGVAKIVLQPDGKILIGGHFTQVNGVTRNRIARLNPDGSLDTTFQNAMTGFALNNVNSTAAVFDLALQSDGKILAVGNFDMINGSSRKYLVRLNTDGSLDTAFLSNLVELDGAVSHIVIERSGKFLISGNFTTVNGQSRRNLAQFNQDGSFDSSFAINFGVNFNVVNTLSVESNGNILVGGLFGLINNQNRTGIFRFLSARPAQYDYDGDGKSDVSVYRPLNGVWYLLNSTAGFSAVQFGISTDKIVPADYDGDGKTDIAVWREGNWYLQQSTKGFASIFFGSSGDIPMPADFDGDGKAELAVYRPSNGSWYVLNLANNQFSSVQFGTAEDKPVTADYDGDGCADYAVYRPSNGTWYLLQSAKGFAVVQFGLSTDKPVVGDFDGDSKADEAVYRTETGTWYLFQSTKGFTAIQFGLATDLPAAADYDGDGKTDIAVFRPTSGTWYQMKSTQGFGAVQFGSNGDKPVPNAFLP